MREGIIEKREERRETRAERRENREERSEKREGRREKSDKPTISLSLLQKFRHIYCFVSCAGFILHHLCP